MKKMITVAISILLIIIVGMFFINGKKADTEFTDKTTKVGFIFNGEIDDKGWGQSHYEAIYKCAEELNLEVMYKENVPFDDTCKEIMEGMISDGCEIIICNSYNYGEWIEQVANKNPDVVFFHATGTEIGDNITTYFGRMYQIRYLCGVVAGLQTETNSIGYVAAFPISEVNRGINAFTLGVQSVNPDATVHVIWSESWTDYTANEVAAQTLIDECDVDVLTMHCDSIAPLDVAEKKGVWSIGYNMDNSELYPNSFLTAAIWNWETFYSPQIAEVLQGKYHSGNYWVDYESGIMDIAPFTENVKDGIYEVVEQKKEMLNSGQFDVFYGPVYDTEGEIRIGEGENMSDEAMLNFFDWYVKGVQIYEK